MTENSVAVMGSMDAMKVIHRYFAKKVTLLQCRATLCNVAGVAYDEFPRWKYTGEQIIRAIQEIEGTYCDNCKRYVHGEHEHAWWCPNHPANVKADAMAANSENTHPDGPYHGRHNAE